MTIFKGTQPFCRCCGKPIRKVTTSVYVGGSGMGLSGWNSRHISVEKPLLDKADCQRHSNQQVLSVQYTVDYDDYTTPKPETRRVCRFTEWDGESYEDEFFCSGECAKRYAYMAVRSPFNKAASVAYLDSVRRKGK